MKVSKIFITLLTLMMCFISVKSQNAKAKVHIEFNAQTEGWFNEYLEDSNNWEIVGDIPESNVIFRVQISKNWGKTFGKIFILDSQTSETIYKSENLKGQSSIFNGYSSKKDLAKKLIADINDNFDISLVNLNHFGTNRNQTSVEAEKMKNQKVNGDKYEKLRELKKLLDEGIITQEEFEKEKRKILDEG